MGGYGSGGGRGALKSGAFWRLDIARFKRIGLLNPGRYTLNWSDSDNETVATINVHSEADRIHLSYRQKWRGDSEWNRVHETVLLDWSNQNFGGKRVWFLCPTCSARRGVLFGRGRYLCRVCQGMVYESQYDPYPQLPWSRCHRVRERLGGRAGFVYPFPARPKGMHRNKYQRLLEEDWRASELLDQGYTLTLGELREKIKSEYGGSA